MDLTYVRIINAPRNMEPWTNISYHERPWLFVIFYSIGMLFISMGKNYLLWSELDI